MRGVPDSTGNVHGRVLVLVDDAKRRERHVFLLEALQLECISAGTWRDATGLAEEHPPNLIFIDLAKDDEAVEASRRLKRHFGGAVPILLSLSLSDVPTQRRVKEAGADDYLLTPVDEVELIFKLRTAVSQARRVQELQRTNARLDGLLRRHVGGPLVDQWMTETDDAAQNVVGREVIVTTLFADINGFTRRSAEWPAEQTVLMLNEILTLCTLPLVDYGGTVDKYIGDCVMAYFGPASEQPEHATRAVRAAVAMQRSLAQWTRTAADMGGDVQVSIGLNTGRAVLGNVGSSLRLDHTVIGDSVNVAARLQDVAPEGCIYAGYETAQETAYRFRWKSHGRKNLRGRSDKVEVFELVGETGRND